MTPDPIHIQWQGPYSLSDAKAFNASGADKGVYQVCGNHPSYGRNALLYIGKTENQTFAQRISQENWFAFQEANGLISIYLGRLHGSSTPEVIVWNELIDCAERLLILSHLPAINSKDLSKFDKPKLYDMHLLNWGERGALLPEVSGNRWSAKFAVIENYGPFRQESD